METQQKKAKKFRGGDIVFTKNGSIQTLPTLNKRLKTVTETVLGLQYIWEYRSPSHSAAPHYQCKLCMVNQMQNEILTHITGWKHGFRYLQQHHPDKVIQYRSSTIDLEARKVIKSIAADVEKAERRDQIRVVFKEPYEVQEFQQWRSALPSMEGQDAARVLGSPYGGHQPGGQFGSGFSDFTLHEEVPSRSGLMSDFPLSMPGGLSDNLLRDKPDMGRLPSPGRYGGSMPNSGSMYMGSGDFGRSPRSEVMDRLYPSDPSVSNGGRMMWGGHTTAEPCSTFLEFLRYLDTYRIENEEHAQIVLKVTQKLTDVLMEYRLRNTSSVRTSGLSDSLDSMNYTSRLSPSSSDRFSGSKTGPSRYYS